MSDELPVDDSWKGSPQRWPAVTAEELTGAAGRTSRSGPTASLLRVALSFRSPKKAPGQMLALPRGRGRGSHRAQRGRGAGRRRDRAGAGRPQGRRHGPAGADHGVSPRRASRSPATFVGTLSDYGALVAKLERPVSSAVTLSGADVLGLRNTLLLAADVKLQGERRVAYYNHGRIQGFDLGWRRQVYPEVAGDERQPVPVHIGRPAGGLPGESEAEDLAGAMARHGADPDGSKLPRGRPG